MCGIAGIYNLSQKSIKSVKSKEETEKVIKKMTDKLTHRGPDDEGFFINDKIALGHRRLSIIDLTEAGHQPMARGDLVIVFNGEIYNYIEIRKELVGKGYEFKTESDTEVILAAYETWGEDCLNKFNGMWAFVIYDRRKDEVFASRDRFGVKPFYYAQTESDFVFASEPKALLESPGLKASINEEIVWDYLAGGLVNHSEETFFEGILALKPGHFLTLKNKELKIEEYWNINQTEAKVPEKVEDQVREFRELFFDAVRLRLRSDVPIGTCLSGGLDSSAIVVVINKLMKEEGAIEQVGEWQKTFSAVYKDKDALYADESEYIKAVNEATGAKGFFTYPTGEDLANELTPLCVSQDEPFASTSMYAQRKVFSLAQENKIKVVLDGQGSDELLGGYLTFFDSYLEELLSQGKIGLFFRELKSFCRNQHRSSIKFFHQFIVKNYFYKWVKKCFKLADFSQNREYAVFEPGFLSKYQLPKPSQISQNSFVNKSFHNLTRKALPSYLRYEDRNSMSASIESRLPFLDYRLAEYVYHLPTSTKIKNGQTKWILREALKDLLPEKILTRHDKMGFTVPESHWMKTSLKDKIKEIFASQEFNERGFTKPGAATKLFEDFLSNKHKNYQLIWRLFNLEIWFREFIDS